MKVDRVILCSAVNHESLFDLDYDNSYSNSEPSIFFKQLTAAGQCISPVVISEGLLLCNARMDEVLLLFISKAPQSVTATERISLIQFSNRLLKVTRDFLGKLTVDNLLANITMFAEIVDCMLIGGYVHLTETDKIRGFLSQSYTESRSPVVVTRTQQAMASPLRQLAGTGYQPTQQQKVVPVSQSNSTPVKEEIYIDLIETLDYKLNTTGETTCLVRGVLNSSNVSNGQKQVNFQFKKGYAKMIGQHTFDGSVRSDQFVTQGLLCADVQLGQTKLMSYQLTTSQLPFTIQRTKTESPDDVNVTLNCQVPAGVMCLKLKVVFSFPNTLRGVVKQAVKVNQTVSLCETDTKCIEWCIPEMAGQTFTSAQFKALPDTQVSQTSPHSMPVKLEFEISNYLHSTCKLHSVKLERAPNVKKWIRHITVSGDCRLHVGLK